MKKHILFESRPGISLALAPDAPKFTVIAATDDFIRVSDLTREAIIGKGLFEVPVPVYLETFLAHRDVLAASLQSVIDDKKPHQLPFRQYYPPDTGREHASYLRVRTIPVLDEDGEMPYIILNWEDITAEIKEEHTQVKFKDIGNAYDLLMQAPLAVGMVKGKDHVLQMANKEAFRLWGRGPEIIGKPLLESMPELKGQGIIELFDQVMDTGETYMRRALPLRVIINGQEHLHYFDIVYQPVLDEEGKKVIGVFTISHEVTSEIEARKQSTESEARLQAALEAAHMGMWDLNIADRKLIVSDELKKIYGLSLDKDYDYETFINSIIEEDRAYTRQVNADIMQLKHGRHDYDIQYRIRRANDGKLRWIRAKGKVHVDTKGKPYRFTGVILDITQQKEAQERFYHIFETVPVSILEKDYSELVGALDELKRIHDAGLKSYLEKNEAEVYRLMALIKVRDINRASLKILDAERKEQLLRGLGVVFTEETIPAFIGELMAVANRDKFYQAEYVLKTLKGRKITCLVTISFPGQQYDNVLLTRYDISELKKAERALVESEERFRTMANSIPQLAWMTDKTGSIYWYNDRWYAYTGTTLEEMLGWEWKKVHHPDMVEGVEKRFREAIAAGREWEDIFLLRSKDGEYRWFLSRAVPVRDDNNAIVGWFGTNTDITDQRKVEQELKKSEEQLQLAIQGGDLGIYDFDPITGEMVWSKRMREMFGFTEDAALSYDLYLDRLYPEDRERSHQAIQGALRGENGGRYEMQYRVQPDGKVMWLRSKGKVSFDKDGKAWRIVGVAMDITAQKEAEEALRQSEQLFRTLANFA